MLLEKHSMLDSQDLTKFR